MYRTRAPCFVCLFYRIYNIYIYIYIYNKGRVCVISSICSIEDITHIPAQVTNSGLRVSFGCLIDRNKPYYWSPEQGNVLVISSIEQTNTRNSGVIDVHLLQISIAIEVLRNQYLNLLT